MVRSIWLVSLISVNNMYNHIIEDWWRHLGLWDRQEVSGYLLENYDGETQIYLESTDEWWESLTYEQKTKAYEDFFTEE